MIQKTFVYSKANNTFAERIPDEVIFHVAKDSFLLEHPGQDGDMFGIGTYLHISDISKEIKWGEDFGILIIDVKTAACETHTLRSHLPEFRLDMGTTDRGRGAGEYFYYSDKDMCMNVRDGKIDETIDAVLVNVAKPGKIYPHWREIVKMQAEKQEEIKAKAREIYEKREEYKQKVMEEYNRRVTAFKELKTKLGV